MAITFSHSIWQQHLPLHMWAKTCHNNLKQSAKNCGKKTIATDLDIILSIMTYGLTSAITCYGKWVSNIARHTFSHTPILGIIILGKHFPQTREAMTEMRQKLSSNQKIKFCSRENQLITYSKTDEKHPCTFLKMSWISADTGKQKIIPMKLGKSLTGSHWCSLQ